MRRPALLILAGIVCVTVVLPAGFWLLERSATTGEPHDCAAADRQLRGWQRGDPRRRSELALAVVRCGTLDGFTGQQVRRTVGAPDRATPTMWIYSLDRSGEIADRFVVRFSPSGHVTSAALEAE